MLQPFVLEKATNSYNPGSSYPWDNGRSDVLSRIIMAPKVVRDALEGTWPQITINSADRSWMKPITEATIPVWTQTAEIFSTWVALGQAADKVNKRMASGEEAASFFPCDGDGATSYHPCGQCGARTSCARLQLHSPSGL